MPGGSRHRKVFSRPRLEILISLKMGKKEKIKAMLDGDKIVLERMVGIEDLAGVFANQAKKITKGMTRKEIELAERKAIEDGRTSRFKKGELFTFDKKL